MEAAAPPLALDDPTLTAHRHRVILAMAGLRSSVISFVRGKQLKRELNEQFRLTHEWLHPSMSLSKLRRCKLLLLTAGADADLELSTVALSYVYLERLCWRNVVEKRNRKLLAAVCLTLAYKYNEGAQLAQRRQQLNTLFTVPHHTHPLTHHHHHHQDRSSGSVDHSLLPSSLPMGRSPSSHRCCCALSSVSRLVCVV